MIIDEIQHFGNKYVNIQIGTVSNSKVNYLIYCEIFTHVNNEVILNAINNVLENFKLEQTKMLLLISDAASYMIKSGKVLKSNNESLFYVTCFAHLAHNCSLKVWSYYKSLDFLITSLKIATIKSSERK